MKPRVTILPPPAVYRDEDLTCKKPEDGLSYTPRFLREAIRRTGGTHEGPTLLLEAVGDDGRVRRVQAVTLLIGSNGDVVMRQDQGVTPAFLEEEKSAKPAP